MKYFGSILDFTHERNADLLRVYRAHLASVRYVIMPDIFALVADSTASRFWVSEERAAIVVSSMLAGRPLPKMRANKREMFEEIFRRFLELRSRFPDENVSRLVSLVVNSPAPRFYLTPRTVGEIIYHIKNGWYERQFDRYAQADGSLDSRECPEDC